MVYYWSKEVTMEIREYNPRAIIIGFRKSAGYETTQEMADALGITKPTWLKYEKEPWRMTLETFDQLEKLLGEDFAEFFWTHKLYKKK